MGPARIAKKDMGKKHFHSMSVLDGDSNCEVVDSPKAPNARARRTFGNVSLKRSISRQTYDESLFLTSCSFLGKAICDHLVVARLKRPWQKSPIDRTHISPYSRQITRGAGKSPQITPSVHRETASRPRLHLSQTLSTL